MSQLLTIDDIDAARREAGISIFELCAATKLSQTNYSRAKSGKSKMRPANLFALARTLTGISGNLDDMARHGQGFFLVYMPVAALVAREINVDMALVRREVASKRATLSADWMQAARVREFATYLMNTGLGIPQAALARVHNVTPAAICQMMRKVENMRDDPAIEAMLERLEQDLRVDI